ncbi:hypothetical protein ABZX82_15375 [Streptomyces griseoflavus]|uniref:hypothetical protein n=1 Tax=Streptomyces griseoflavus TaxID=35619 RepID=UPI0033B76E8A
MSRWTSVLPGRGRGSRSGTGRRGPADPAGAAGPAGGARGEVNRGPGGPPVEDVDGVLLVRAVEDDSFPLDVVAEVAGAVGAEADVVTVIVGSAAGDGASGADHWARLGELLDSLRARGTDRIRLVMSGAGDDRPDRPCVARRIADAWELEVTAPDGTVLITPGGTLFVHGDARPGCGWWRFAPGARPRRLGRRAPAPVWEEALDGVPERTDGGCVVDRVPAGVHIRPAGAPGPGPDDLSFSVPVDAERLTVLVGAPQAEDVAADEVAAVLAGLPEAERARSRLAPGGRRDLLRLGQQVADLLGSEMEVLTGLPLLDDHAPPGTPPRATLVGRDGRPTWRPFVSSVVCGPVDSAGRAPVPRPAGIHPPDWILGGGEPGTVRLTDRWQATVTRAGLALWAPDGPRPGPVGPAVDPEVCAVELGMPGQPLDDSLLPALSRLLRGLGTGVRSRTTLLVRGRLLAGDGALRRLAADHGIPAIRYVTSARPPLPATAAGSGRLPSPAGTPPAAESGRSSSSAGVRPVLGAGVGGPAPAEPGRGAPPGAGGGGSGPGVGGPPGAESGRSSSSAVVRPVLGAGVGGPAPAEPGRGAPPGAAGGGSGQGVGGPPGAEHGRTAPLGPGGAETGRTAPPGGVAPGAVEGVSAEAAASGARVARRSGEAPGGSQAAEPGRPTSSGALGRRPGAGAAAARAGEPGVPSPASGPAGASAAAGASPRPRAAAEAPRRPATGTGAPAPALSPEPTRAGGATADGESAAPEGAVGVSREGAVPGAAEPEALAPAGLSEPGPEGRSVEGTAVVASPVGGAGAGSEQAAARSEGVAGGEDVGSGVVERGALGPVGLSEPRPEGPAAEGIVAVASPMGGAGAGSEPGVSGADGVPDVGAAPGAVGSRTGASDAARSGAEGAAGEVGARAAGPRAGASDAARSGAGGVVGGRAAGADAGGAGARGHGDAAGVSRTAALPFAPGHVSGTAERAAFRDAAAGAWEGHAAAVSRVLTRMPALRGHELEAARTDLVAAHAYLTAEEGPLHHRELIRDLHTGEGRLLPYAGCLASALRRLPSYRGVALRGGDTDGPAPAVGTLLQDPAPVSALAGSTALPAGAPVRYAVWSVTGRKVRGLLDRPGGSPDAYEEIVFVPGTGFRVLGVRTPPAGPPVVLLRELPGNATAYMDGSRELSGLDLKALAHLEEALARGFRTGDGPRWPQRCSGPVGQDG